MIKKTVTVTPEAIICIGVMFNLPIRIKSIRYKSFVSLNILFSCGSPTSKKINQKNYFFITLTANPPPFASFIVSFVLFVTTIFSIVYASGFVFQSALSASR